MATIITQTITRNSCKVLHTANHRPSLLKFLSTSPVIGEGLVEEVPTEGEWAGCSRRFMAPLKISARGGDILTDPLFNKGLSFKSGERDRLRFRGLLPARIFNMQLQAEHFLETLRAEESNIRKYLLLEDLHDRNETLYHRVLVSKWTSIFLHFSQD